MTLLHSLQQWVLDLHLPIFLIVGVFSLAAYLFGNVARLAKLPSIIGFMLIGVVLGPSIFNVLSEHIIIDLSFITSLALSFVALSIGLELKFSSLKSQGKAMVWIILGESFMAFIIVFLVVYLLSGDLVLAILFGAIAPPSAPAGTVAVIQEYRAKGKLTNALFAVVGFDDGLGIVIFGFASAFAFSILSSAGGGESGSLLTLIGAPLLEIILSIAVGGALSFVYSALARNKRSSQELLILTAAFLFVITGLAELFGLSFILANMVFGIVVVNTQSSAFVQKIRDVLLPLMPFLFLLFFTLAGANLHLSALPALGIVGLGYILGRSAGKIAGATLGSVFGKASATLRKYLGLGILSQAGVAIGLSLVLKQELAAYGQRGVDIGGIVITTITATSIVFEIIGPIFARIALKKAGEITT